MAQLQPAGRLAKVVEQGIVIQIQTEFSWRPHPYIATSVYLDGVVLHKITKDWSAPVESDEQLKVVDRFINRQHNEIVAIIEGQKGELVQKQKRRSSSDTLQILLAIDGVNAAWCLTSKGIISPESGGRELLPEYAQIFEGLVSLCEFLTNITSIGDLIEGSIVLEDDHLMIATKGDHYYVVGYGKDYRGQIIMGDVRRVLEA